MTESPARGARHLIAAVALAAALIGSVAGVAFASHQFSDVPDSQPHHDNINALVDSGCATGFDDGSYRPGDPVTRGQVARQVAQCGVRIAEGSGTSANPADNTFVSIGTAAIRAGGQDPTHTGFIRLDARVDADVASSDCPCSLSIRVHNDNTNTNTAQIDSAFETTCVIFVDCGSLTFSDVVPAGNTTAGNTYRVQAKITTSGGNTSITLDGYIIAEYIPFGGDPTNT